jgi:hypothetical protein
MVSHLHAVNTGTSTSDEMPAVEYLRLLEECREIRLLELHSDNSGSLQYVPLDNAPDFLALSYVWGDPTQVVPFYVDGQKILLHQALANALPRIVQAVKMRHGFKDKRWPKFIWADAICINQRDDVEKAQQVAMMDSIYRRASVIVVDVEDGQGGRSDVPVWIYGDGSWGRFSTILSQHPHIPDLISNKGLATLLRHPWWNRIWTLQEIVLARKAAFLIRNITLDWNEILQLSDLLREVDEVSISHGYEAAQVTMDITHGGFSTKTMLARKGNKYIQNAPWFSLLAATTQFEASDARDQLYALTGLCQELSGFEISYNLPVGKVFHDFTTRYLETNGTLELLQLCGVNLPKGWNLPSWVPNYENLNHAILMSYSDRLQSKHGYDHIQNEFKVWDACNGRQPRLHKSPKAIITTIIRPEGIQVDTISHVNDLKGDWLSFAWNYIGAQYHPPSMKCHILQAYFRTVLGDHNEDTNMPLSTCIDRYQVAGTFWNIIRKKQNKLIQKMHISSRIQDLLVETTSAEAKSFTVQLHPNFTRISRLIHRNETQLHFFVTSHGYMGYGPHCVEDDVICVLFGCSVPLILRQKEHGRWMIVGQCFVLGIMNGELCRNLVELDDPFRSHFRTTHKKTVWPPAKGDEEHPRHGTAGPCDDDEQQSGQAEAECPLLRMVEVFNIC